MIRLKHTSGSQAGAEAEFDKRTFRLGTADDCELRFDAWQETGVRAYHAAIAWKDDAYHLLELDRDGQLSVNGQPIADHTLRTGDRIRLGPEGGPELEVTLSINPDYDPAEDAARIVEALKEHTREERVVEVVERAAERVAEERARAGGVSSRQTMEFMAVALSEASEAMKSQTRRRWGRGLALVVVLAALVIGTQRVIILRQQARIAEMQDAKRRFDEQIGAIQQRMEAETDNARLAVLERQLVNLESEAQKVLAEIARRDEAAAAASESGDSLDRQLRRLLRDFGAETYAIDPIFRERVAFHLSELTAALPTTVVIYRRKVRYWPVISSEFQTLELPEVMGYLAWSESSFDPDAISKAGAVGMWQMTEETARSLGLRIDATVDERLDVGKQSRAAARHLAMLLGEFGEDSFMLVMASYNRGENGVRRVLRQVAEEPGGFKRAKRNFWHLYRLKLLPPETREYVPRVFAAALVCTYPESYGLSSQ
jgi:soluble lytic murein transglycosylase-like protein